MNFNIRKTVLILCLTFFAGLQSSSLFALNLYISPAGNDSWSGKLSEPDKNKSDGSFRTLERARDTIRKMKETGKFPQKGFTVYLRGGDYIVDKTFKFTSEDSGTKKQPVIWRNFSGEKVTFLGGKRIGGFEPVKDQSILDRLNKSAKNSIFQTDLKAQGITDFGEIDPRKGGRLEIYFKNNYMTLARFPNEGWVTIADVPQTGDKIIYEGDKGEHAIRNGIPAGRHYGRFQYSGDRPDNWKQLNDIWMYGYWTWDWSDSYQKIENIDKTKKEIYPAEPHHWYGYTKGQRYYYLNILEELDSPGEWYLDRTTGILYFWPPEKTGAIEVVVPVFNDTMFLLDNVSNIKLTGLIFEGSRGGAVNIKGGTGNLIAGCTFRNLGNDAVTIDGKNNGIISCDVYNVSRAGIVINGGDRKTLTPAGNFAENNHVHHYSQVIRTYCSAIGLYGVGNRISHNYIHDAPHEGIRYEGNELLMEYNEISDVVQETGDAPAIGTAFDWTYCGNTIRYNYFHHIHGPGNGLARIIYLDLPAGGATIYGNIIYDADMGFFTNSGRNNVIENNIFVKCGLSIGYNIWLQPEMFMMRLRKESKY